jgi:uncharacterized protein (TIGR00369 family)
MIEQLPTTNFGVEIPFVAHLGFVLTVFANGQSEVDFTPRHEHLNSYSVVHGGVVMTLLDVSMAMAARTEQPELGVVTIEMKTSFMQPSRGPLSAKARVIHRSATLAFTEATVLDAHGKTCAHATGTFKFIRRLPVGGKSSQPLNAPSAPEVMP